MLLLSILIPANAFVFRATRQNNSLRNQPQYVKTTIIWGTHSKLFGSPEFQFSKVSGLPVDIQKNLQQLNLGMCFYVKLKNIVKEEGDDAFL